jgi:hypothetical protein
VALAAVKGGKTLADLAQQYHMHPNLINQWRGRSLEGAANVFGAEPAAGAAGPGSGAEGYRISGGSAALFGWLNAAPAAITSPP